MAAKSAAAWIAVEATVTDPASTESSGLERFVVRARAGGAPAAAVEFRWVARCTHRAGRPRRAPQHRGRLGSAHTAALRGGVMDIGYTNYTNVDAHFDRPYERGDRLVRGYRGTIDIAGAGPVEDIAERLFARHNRDDRPDGGLCPSMSVGDVVIVGEVAVSVDSCGWCRVHPDHADLITDRSWRAVIAEPPPEAAPAGVVRGIVSGSAAPAPTPPPIELGIGP